MTNDILIIFGDKIGLPAIIDVLPNNVQAVAIIDPLRGRPTSLPAHIPILPFPTKDKRQAFIKKLASLNPKLGLINSFSRILWPELINIFPFGVVNVHLSKLPEYRGANTLQWTLINGETQTAATLHIVDEGIDTGPIVEQKKVKIAPDDTALTLQTKLLDAANELLCQWLPVILRKPATGIVQDERKAQTWPRRTPEDGRIDWAWSNKRIRDLTRALVSPWPGAWYEKTNGKCVVIDRVLSIREIRNLRQELGK